jgi:hypothetical protein
VTIKQHFLRFGLGSLLISGLALAGSSDVLAKHQWNDFHLQIPTGGLAVEVDVTFHSIDVDQSAYVDSLGDWQAMIDLSGGDVFVRNDQLGAGFVWETNDPLFLPDYRSRIAQSYQVDDGSGDGTTENCEWADSDSNTANDCATVVAAGISGTSSNPIRANAFDGDYGNNGWLGIAIIEDELIVGTGTSHIFYGEIYINNFYDSTFATNVNGRKYVFCQEFGHISGLDHLKKDEGSCMYTPRRLTQFFGSNPGPNIHDGEMINLISHDATAHGGDGGDGGDGDPPGNCPPRGPNACFELNPRITAFWEQRFDNEEDMFEAADLVVSATVLSGSSFSHMEGFGGPSVPVSHVTLKVSETYKGFSKPVITLVQNRGPGFEIDDDPGYVQGDDYTLYLVNLGSGNYRIVSPDGRIRQ